jgi:hypothetical protein
LGFIEDIQRHVGAADNCCNQAWVLKNSFQEISPVKFVRKLLNIRSPQLWKFAEITALVPFSTPAGVYAHDMERPYSGWVTGESGVSSIKSRSLVN